MKKLLLGVAILPFLAGITMAQEPTKLTGVQMDKVTAGWDLLEIVASNTSLTGVSIYQRPSNTIGCTGCYLKLNSSAFSVASAFGPPSGP